MVKKHLGISLEHSKKILEQCFKTLLFNLSHTDQHHLIKLIESFVAGGWIRIYSIIINLINLKIEQSNGDFSFEFVLDDIKEWTKEVNILTVGIKNGHSRFKEAPLEIIITEEEVEAYENQYLLSQVIKKTEKLYKIIKNNMKERNSGKMSFRSFFRRKFHYSNNQLKIDMNSISQNVFKTEEEKQLFTELINLYHVEYSKINKDTDSILVKINKVEDDLTQHVMPKYNNIQPKYEEMKNLYDMTKQKLDIMVDTKAILKKDIFIKKQDSKMLSTRRLIKRKQIRNLKTKQNDKPLNENPNTPEATNQEIDYQMEYEKDRLANKSISRNSEIVKSLTSDVEQINAGK